MFPDSNVLKRHREREDDIFAWVHGLKKKLKLKITEVCLNSGRTALLHGFDANNMLLSEAIRVCVMTIGTAFPAKQKMFAFEKVHRVNR